MPESPRSCHPLRTCAALVICAAIAGCGSMKPIRGSGVLASESRDLRGFSAIELTGIGTVRLRQSGTESVTVEAEQNLLPLLTTTVDNGTLRMGTKPNSNLRPSRPIVFHVSADRVDGIRVSGSGNVEAGGLKATTLTMQVSGSGNVRAESVEAEKVTARISGSGGMRVGELHTRALRCDISGSGDARLAGRADGVDLSVSGSGSLDAADLTCNAADVSIAGSGNVRLGMTSQRLSADVSGSGSLRYRGKPAQVQTHISGSGSVSRDAG